MMLFMLAISALSIQDQASSTTISFNSNMKPALVLELPNSLTEVEGTIIQKLKQTGFDPETKGHFFWRSNKTDGLLYL